MSGEISKSRMTSRTWLEFPTDFVAGVQQMHGRRLLEMPPTPRPCSFVPTHVVQQHLDALFFRLAAQLVVKLADLTMKLSSMLKNIARLFVAHEDPLV
jgi:hypothetical protein